MANSVIKINKVTKNYGSARGVQNISLEIPQGMVFGFLGPNGAGKTTTISMLIDLIRPTSGKISIFGMDSINESRQIRQRIGFLAGDFSLDRGLTGWQQLEYFGNLRGNFDKKYVRELGKRLDFNLNRKFKTLSRGNKQKLGLISALMHKPELLIFDEPTSGLDPLIQAEFNKIVFEHRQQGKSAFISSHLLSEVQETCDRIAFIREGRIIAVENMTDIAAGLPKHVHVLSDDKTLGRQLRALKGVTVLKSTGAAIEFSFLGTSDSLLSLLAKHKINDVAIREADLETVFMKFYSGGKDAK